MSILHHLSASELIINQHGHIYHLDIGPQHLAPTVITVGDPGRVNEVSKHFDRITHRAQHREFVTHTGYIGSKHLSVVSTGIGPDNIDIIFNELDALANIDFNTRSIKEEKTSLSIIRLGTCGSLQRDVPVDSFVVSSHGIGLDNLLHYYMHSNTPDEITIINEFQRHTNLGAKHIVPYITEASIALRKHFGATFVHGMTATCPGFYGPQGRVIRAPIAFPHLLDALATFQCNGNRITNFEMETSALYGLGKILGHKCLSISAVVANRADKTFSKDNRYTVEQLIKKSLEVIAAI